jgi:hypothetical protein
MHWPVHQLDHPILALVFKHSIPSAMIFFLVERRYFVVNTDYPEGAYLRPDVL